MSDQLLPPNATALEKSIEQLGRKFTALPVPFIQLHRIDQCPVAHLPWLAWQHRIEYWNPDWTEAEKRNAISESVAFNQQRGTRSSMQSLLSTVISTYQLKAWHEMSPRQPAFTFIVDIPPTILLSMDQLLQILTAIEATKSVRDTYSINARVLTKSNFNVGGGSVAGIKSFLTTNMG